MITVETLLGPVPVEQIGRTLTHEHVFTKNPELELSIPDPEWLGDAEMVDIAATTLNNLHVAGIDTIVDLTVPGLGRNIPLVVEVAKRTDVHIVAATGWYTFDQLPAYFNTHGPGLLVDMDDPLKTLFVKDLTTGIGDSGVKAQMIKVATDAPGITPALERVLRAAAYAHNETGATITTHTHAADHRGNDQQAFFKSQGVPLEHIVIGHSGDTDDIDYLKGLLDNGSSLGLDRFGVELLLSDDKRVDVLVQLVELGYVDQLTLSHDAGVFSVNLPPSARAKIAPDWRFDHISTDILPMARERGLTDQQLHQIMVGNAARLLVGAR